MTQIDIFGLLISTLGVIAILLGIAIILLLRFIKNKNVVKYRRTISLIILIALAGIFIVNPASIYYSYAPAVESGDQVEFGFAINLPTSDEIETIHEGTAIWFTNDQLQENPEILKLIEEISGPVVNAEGGIDGDAFKLGYKYDKIRELESLSGKFDRIYRITSPSDSEQFWDNRPETKKYTEVPKFSNFERILVFKYEVWSFGVSGCVRAWAGNYNECDVSATTILIHPFWVGPQFEIEQVPEGSCDAYRCSDGTDVIAGRNILTNEISCSCQSGEITDASGVPIQPEIPTNPIIQDAPLEEPVTSPGLSCGDGICYKNAQGLAETQSNCPEDCLDPVSVTQTCEDLGGIGYDKAQYSCSDEIEEYEGEKGCCSETPTKKSADDQILGLLILIVVLFALLFVLIKLRRK